MRFNQTGNNATFTRSDIGNISNVNLNGTGAARSYSDVHELTSIGGQTQIFDADGNLVQMGNGSPLTWDDAGRLETVVAQNNPVFDGDVSFGYDATGKRSIKTTTLAQSNSPQTTIYIYAGPNCIAEYSSGTAATSPDVEFVYAQGIDSVVLVDDGTDELAVLRNQQWSVTALVNNSTGSVAERYAYDHFGKRTIYAANGTTVRTVSSHKNPFGYTSRRHDDETELMYYRARYYDTETGEFISQDPLEYVDGMSQYRAYFVPGGVDPEGTLISDPVHIAGAVAAAALIDFLVCFKPFIEKAEQKWPLLDRRKHCYVSCRSSRTCGRTNAFNGGNLKEMIDLVRALGIPAKAKQRLIVSFEDQVANWSGRRCAGFETHAPGIGLITGWCRQSCEDCCISKGY
jgi:RHS repeat-associated protein